MKKLLSFAVSVFFIASMAMAQQPATKPAAATTSKPEAKKECSSTHSCCSKDKKAACGDKKTADSKSTTKPAK